MTRDPRQPFCIAAFPAAALLAGAVLLGGCARTDVYGESTGTGILTGYELGNERDLQDQRKERPDYRPYE